MGYEIQNLYINRAAENQGLFGYSSGTIKNLSVTGSITSNANYVGGVCAYSNYGAVIENCHTNMTLSGLSWVGGISGYSASSTITNCSSTGSSTGKSTSTTSTGGLIGAIATNTVVSSCYSSGEVIGDNGQQNGGLIGRSDTNSSISNCYSSANVTGDGYVGGLIGYMLNGSIYRCYATGSTSIGPNYMGGLCGAITMTTTPTSVDKCYAAGKVNSTSGSSGGLIGYKGGSASVSITDSYWDKTTTGKTTSAGSDNSYGKTTAEMKQSSTFVGWDTEYDWYVDEGNSYPLLNSIFGYNVAGVLRHWKNNLWLSTNDLQAASEGVFSSKPLKVYDGSRWLLVVTNS